MSIDRLLDLPAQEGVRLRALELLEDVAKERARLDALDDPEAVHDFRVALRRLRSLLKAHRPRLGRKVEKLRRNLGAIADQTSAARDAEVQLAWLQTQRAGLQAAALDWLRARLEAAKERGYAAARGDAARDLDALLPKARRRLARFVRDLTAGAEPSLAAAVAGLLVTHADELAARLAAIGSAVDEVTAHEARILGKQLRYLLEPLADSERAGAGAKLAVKKLKELQDVLGELHDAHVLGHVVSQAIVDAATESARQIGAAVFHGTARGAARRGDERPRDVRPGLVAVAQRVRARRDGLYRDLTARRPGVAALVADVRALADRLAGPGPDVEIERKFLLGAMPALDGAEVVEIEQGYLPGARLQERLRRVRGPDHAERLVRGVKVGTGLRRVEIEEDCPRELFDKLWPLTAGRRIAKTRYRVRDGGLVWEIDCFVGRDLLLAEVELPNEATEVTPPGWLSGAIVREVTGEREFSNEALASVPAAGKPGPAQRRARRASRKR